MAGSEPTHPLVILGLDVGDPDLLERWVGEGHLPTLASLMERGVWGRTTGPDLLTEHGVWVSLLSGVSISRHGFYYYRRLKPGTYELETITGRDARARPFWSRLVGTDKRVATVDVPRFGPELDVPGIQVSEWASHFPSFPPSTSPPELIDEVQRVFGPPMVLSEMLHSTPDQDRRLLASIRERVRKKGRLCRHLLHGDRFDLTVIVFGDPHVTTHQFWPYRPGATGAEARSEGEDLTHAIRQVHQDIDRELELLLDDLPEDANVCVVSSTGMLDHYPTSELMWAFCRELGYQAALPEQPARVSPLGLARRLLPVSLRQKLSQWLLSEEARQRLETDKFFQGIDWSNTTAFPIPSFFEGLIRVNLKGREPEGTVSAEDYDATLDRIEEDLRQLVDPETGAPAVEEVIRTRQVLDFVEPEYLPDLLVIWRPVSHCMTRLVHPKVELIQELGPEMRDFHRGSSHSRHGFVALAGPSVPQRGGVGPVDLLDLAPTFLSLLGESVPDEMDGQSLLGTGPDSP